MGILIFLVASITGSKIADVAVKYVEEFVNRYSLIVNRTTNDSTIFSITPIRIPASVSLPDGDYKFEAEIQNPTHIMNGTSATLVWVKIMDTDKIIKSVPVVLKVKSLSRMVVAKKRIKKHKILTSHNICMKLCDADIGNRHVYSLQDAVGKRAKKVIGSGQVIISDMIELVPLVLAQNPVEIVYKSNNVTISTNGMAEEDGWMNNIIKVQVFSKSILAKVSGINCVTVN